MDTAFWKFWRASCAHLLYDCLIFVFLEDWGEVWRRNQFLCAGLARRFPERKILFVPAEDAPTL